MKIERLPNNSVKVTMQDDETVFHSQRMEFVLAPGETCQLPHKGLNHGLNMIMPIIEHIAEPAVMVERCGGVITVKNLQSAYTPLESPTRTVETQQKIETIKALIEELGYCDLCELGKFTNEKIEERGVEVEEADANWNRPDDD
jgi:hypothetical protein